MDTVRWLSTLDALLIGALPFLLPPTALPKLRDTQTGAELTTDGPTTFLYFASVGHARC